MISLAVYSQSVPCIAFASQQKLKPMKRLTVKQLLGTRFSKLLILWEISPWIKLKAGFYMF